MGLGTIRRRQEDVGISRRGGEIVRHSQ